MNVRVIRDPKDRTLSLSETSRSAHEPLKLTHLQRLEAESIHIIREVVAECENPVMLYSMARTVR